LSVRESIIHQFNLDMSLLQNIQKKLGQWILNSKLKQHERQAAFRNYQNVATVGIIFNATQQGTYDLARQYIKKISEKGIKYKALGFVDSKQVLDFYQKSSHFDYFSRKNINWYGKPNNPSAQEFTDTEFDMLIDLSIENDYPIQYIVALSQACFKVGSKKVGQQNHYDLMIDLGEQKELAVLIEQIDFYLEMIKI